MRIAAATVAAGVVFCLAPLARATVFYVSPTGKNGHRGTSPSAAWRTVSRVNRTRLRAGDTVLFRGGATFKGTLMPRRSGRRGAPITFSSYGTGQANIRGGITLVSMSWIRIARLRVDRGNWRKAGDVHGVMSHDSGSGSTHISIRDCAFRNVRFGLLLTNHGDSNWVVKDTLIQRTRDSGILIFGTGQATGVGGDHLFFERNSVLDTGLDSSIRYPKHAIYDKGTNTTLRGNVIRRWSSERDQPGAGVTLRAHSTTLEGNQLSGGQYGITWVGYDPVGGLTKILGNTISNVRHGISLQPGAGPVKTRESFSIDGNTIVTRATSLGRGDAIYAQRIPGLISITRNLIGGVHRYALWIAGLPHGRFVEHHNRWNGNGGAERWNYLGVAFSSLLAYQVASGQGAGDSVGR